MLRPFLLLVPAVALSACAANDPYSGGIESVHQPVVQQHDYAFDVLAAPGGLAPGEAARVAGWFASMRLGYSDRITVDDPAGYGAGPRNDVARQAAQFGIILGDAAPVTATPVAPGSVRVVVSRATASVPGCPDFTRYRGTDPQNGTTSNFGCATNTNLAAMIADPMDLVRGAPDADVYDPQIGARAITSYRKAAPTGAGGSAIKAEGTGGK